MSDNASLCNIIYIINTYIYISISHCFIIVPSNPTLTQRRREESAYRGCCVEEIITINGHLSQWWYLSYVLDLVNVSAALSSEPVQIISQQTTIYLTLSWCWLVLNLFNYTDHFNRLFDSSQGTRCILWIKAYSVNLGRMERMQFLMKSGANAVSGWRLFEQTPAEAACSKERPALTFWGVGGGGRNAK